MKILPGNFDPFRPTAIINIETGEKRIESVSVWRENPAYFTDGTLYYHRTTCRDIGRGAWILVNYRSDDHEPIH